MIRKVIKTWHSSRKRRHLPDVLLHIGAPKTGTSAIQRFCQTHREALAELGYLYPEHALDVNGVSGGHTQLAGALLQGIWGHAEERLAAWHEEARKRQLCLLLSAESFYGQHVAMKELACDLEVRVVGFLRHPVEYLIGNYNQGIKRHMETRRLSRLLPDLLSGPTENLVGRPFLEWANAFGDANCKFMPYRSPNQETASIEQCFLQALGMAEAEIQALVGKTDITNRSYVGSALELKRLLNIVLPELPETVAHHVDWSLQGYSDRAVDEQSDGATNLPEEICERLNEQLLRQMAPVVERFPALKEVVDTPVRRAGSARSSWLNLNVPLATLAEDHPQDVAQIREVAIAQRESGRCDYDFYKLLDALGIEFNEPALSRAPLTPEARKVLTNEASREADYLREMAVMLERMGFLDDALMVITQAMAKRPNGHGILRIKARIEGKLGARRNLEGARDSSSAAPARHIVGVE